MIYRRLQLYLMTTLAVCLSNFGRSFAYSKQGAMGTFRRHTSIIKTTEAAIEFKENDKSSVTKILEDTTKTPETKVLGNKGRIILSVPVITALLTFRQHIAPLCSLLFQGYKSSLINKPYITKAMTGATLAVIGDFLAQKREKSENGYDEIRALSFACFDACYRLFQTISIPLVSFYGQGRVLRPLFSMLGLGENSIAVATATERTILYQFCVIPFIYYPVFFAFTGMMQGLNLKEAFERAKKSFLPCWTRNITFWIPAQLVMFGLISDTWIIPYSCVMGIMWSTILSVTAGKANK